MKLKLNLINVLMLKINHVTAFLKEIAGKDTLSVLFFSAVKRF